MPNHLHPLIHCHYKQLEFLVIMNELTAIAVEPTVPDMAELLTYENINTVANIIRAKLAGVIIYKVELISSIELVEYEDRFSSPLIFNQQPQAKIVAKTKECLELISYYLSESNILKLPPSGLPRLQTPINSVGQQLVIESWQEITLIERHSYISCSLSGSEFSSNIYASHELTTHLCKIATIVEFNLDSCPAMAQFVELFNQVFSCNLKPIAVWCSRFNRIGRYLKILLSINGVKGYILLDNWDDLSRQLNNRSSAALQPSNSLLNLALPFPLVHGEAALTLAELAKLQQGDVIIFDNHLAPDYVMINFTNLNYKFKLVAKQLIFCEVIQ
jgi:hypothetical protein